MSKTEISSYEYDILKAMDMVYCEEVNKELTAQANKRHEEHKRRMEQESKSRAARRR